MQPTIAYLVIVCIFLEMSECFLPILSDSFLKFQETLASMNQLTITSSENEETKSDLRNYKKGLSNKDLSLNASEFITKQGFPVEEYQIKTRDGYVLTVIRIPKRGPVLFLMHGLFNSAYEFISSGKDKALAFLASKAGYDVWLGNARGNMYSRKHVSMSPDSGKFWDFSWHEIGVHDLSACIDFIILKSGRERIFYLGHSQGTTTSYVLLSERPEYNHKMILVMSLAPVAWMKHVISPIPCAMVPLRDDALFWTQTIGLHEFLPSNLLINTVQAVMCGASLTASVVCGNVIFLLCGYDYPQLNFTLFPLQIHHAPAGSATKQFIHYLQEIHSGKFQQFDHGKKNLKLYGTKIPPEYNISKITAPVALYYADNDWLSHPKDVKKLMKRLPNMVHAYKVPYRTFNHMDYIWGNDAKSLVYDDLFELMENYK